MSASNAASLGLLSVAVLAFSGAQAPLLAQGSVERIDGNRLSISAASPDLKWFAGLTQVPGANDSATLLFSEATGTTLIPSFIASFADVSADGSAVMTSFRGPLGTSTAGIWTAQGKTDLGDLGGSPGTFGSVPFAMSDDANHVVGLGYLDNSLASVNGFLWSRGSGMAPLLTPAGWSSFPLEVSNDGSIVTGNLQGQAGQGLRPVRWIDGVLSPLPFSGRVGSASRDGRSVCGDVDGSLLRWKEGSGVEILGGLPPRSTLREFALGQAISDDGRTILGAQGVQLLQPMGPPILAYFRWFVWREGQGLIEARDLLNSLGAFELAARDISTITVLSGDGNTVVGYSFSFGEPEGTWWKATLPPID